MKVKYKDFMGFKQENTVQGLIFNELDETSYDHGQFEKIGYSQDNIIEFLGQLVAFLIKNNTISLEQLQELCSKELLESEILE